MNEKERIIILALLETVLMVVFYAVVDPTLGGGVPAYYGLTGQKESTLTDWQKSSYWMLMPLLYGLIAFSFAFASLLGDYGRWSREDFWGAVLLLFTPFWLVVSGLLDHISASFIGYGLTGVFAEGFPWLYDWWWMDGWSLAYWLSRLFGFARTQGFMIFISEGVSLPLLAFFWWLYYKYA